jgi:FixJ family two-component response regulator
MTLPTMNGLDLQERIAAEVLHMPIIFVTGYRNVPMAIQAMKAGAFDFFTKPVDANELLKAIVKAIDHSKRTLRDAADLRTLSERFLAVTSREREVMDLLVSGLLNKEVADKLGIGLSTVKVHRGSIMRKMAAKSLADLVRMHAKLGEARLSKNAELCSTDS